MKFTDRRPTTALFGGPPQPYSTISELLDGLATTFFEFESKNGRERGKHEFGGCSALFLGDDALEGALGSLSTNMEPPGEKLEKLETWCRAGPSQIAFDVWV